MFMYRNMKKTSHQISVTLETSEKKGVRQVHLLEILSEKYHAQKHSDVSAPSLITMPSLCLIL